MSERKPDAPKAANTPVSPDKQREKQDKEKRFQRDVVVTGNALASFRDEITDRERDGYAPFFDERALNAIGKAYYGFKQPHESDGELEREELEYTLQSLASGLLEMGKAGRYGRRADTEDSLRELGRRLRDLQDRLDTAAVHMTEEPEISRLFMKAANAADNARTFIHAELSRIGERR